MLSVFNILTLSNRSNSLIINKRVSLFKLLFFNNLHYHNVNYSRAIIIKKRHFAPVVRLNTQNENERYLSKAVPLSPAFLFQLIQNGGALN